MQILTRTTHVAWERLLASSSRALAALAKEEDRQLSRTAAHSLVGGPFKPSLRYLMDGASHPRTVLLPTVPVGPATDTKGASVVVTTAASAPGWSRRPMNILQPGPPQERCPPQPCPMAATECRQLVQRPWPLSTSTVPPVTGPMESQTCRGQ